MQTESARMTTAEEARYRINYPNSSPRAVKVVALDPPSEAAVKSFALANAAPYLHPRRVWFLPEMPLAGTNKIDRRTLAQRAAELLSQA